APAREVGREALRPDAETRADRGIVETGEREPPATERHVDAARRLLLKEDRAETAAALRVLHASVTPPPERIARGMIERGREHDVARVAQLDGQRVRRLRHDRARGTKRAGERERSAARAVELAAELQ